MSNKLRSGQGQCFCTGRLEIRPSQFVIEASRGADPIEGVIAADLLEGVLRDVHHVNRYAGEEGFLAVTIPNMNQKDVAGSMGVSPKLVIYGSLQALQNLTRANRVAPYVKRGGLILGDIEPVSLNTEDQGVAFVRNHVGKKNGAAYRRRMQKRAEARGETYTAPPRKGPGDANMLRLQFGDVRVCVDRMKGKVSAEVVVNTYGFSTPSCPSYLPA